MSTPYSIQDRLAVVTGGASGIGAALARALATEGARTVVVADLAGAAAAETAEALPGGVGVALEVDVTDADAVGAAVARIESDLGPIDVWCSNAGVARGRGLGDVADWAASWEVHVLAHVHAATHVLPRMVARDSGRLVLTASAAGLLTNVDSAPYSVTKHGTVALAEWLAITCPAEGVAVSCLCPQGVRTPMLAGAGPDSATLAAGAVLGSERVAEDVITALRSGTFLILPHPKVAEYERRRAADRDRWLGAMRRARSRQGDRAAEVTGDSGTPRPAGRS
ncbi:NAD(P)-dependent dehydrogenase (short-subunit alcohol dehydrogenase family) [Actinoalloteichus hoggarensis]|uniref:1-deoxy-11-beta-hydroxypentalenate dehydrogenase n=1 Tax=Actinoalloteichus hoggarensis TaxID=1470176 RepID=A0A221W330_9PSEU|nr:SDR family oxidoreductase [Actinoalloteichus hoggarensis]ASO20185.1 1-deoxy-11-beta-hydroxypentalenate dehydrogenase [Actinoalloteichus hoggarensis]MBB5919102.1 NAD(P)-dependent dehydrogenase (short-subunit alcohol dehydrogenase family) [Actinoalloteichus hoggarensis]